VELQNGISALKQPPLTTAEQIGDCVDDRANIGCARPATSPRLTTESESQRLAGLTWSRSGDFFEMETPFHQDPYTSRRAARGCLRANGLLVDNVNIDKRIELQLLAATKRLERTRVFAE
jgi:hypothetical protein